MAFKVFYGPFKEQFGDQVVESSYHDGEFEPCTGQAADVGVGIRCTGDDGRRIATGCGRWWKSRSVERGECAWMSGGFGSEMVTSLIKYNVAFSE